jgi:hypothetical protein
MHQYGADVYEIDIPDYFFRSQHQQRPRPCSDQAHLHPAALAA